VIALMTVMAWIDLGWELAVIFCAATSVVAWAAYYSGHQRGLKDAMKHIDKSHGAV
jgi:hypothetical protein